MHDAVGLQEGQTPRHVQRDVPALAKPPEFAVAAALDCVCEVPALCTNLKSINAGTNVAATTSPLWYAGSGILSPCSSTSNMMRASGLRSIVWRVLVLYILMSCTSHLHEFEYQAQAALVDAGAVEGHHVAVVAAEELHERHLPDEVRL